MKLNQFFTKTLCTTITMILLLLSPQTVLAGNMDTLKSNPHNNKNQEPIAEIQYTSTNAIDAKLKANRRTMNVIVSITTKSNKIRNDGSISLQKSEKGAWKTVAKWKFAEIGSHIVFKNYSGKRGTYRVYVCGKVGSDRITNYSDTVTIK